MRLYILTQENAKKIYQQIDGLRPSFRKIDEVEVIAESESVLIGKYLDYILLFADKKLDLEMDPIDEFEVVVKELDDGLPFSHGLYRFSENMLEIHLNREMDIVSIGSLLTEVAVIRVLTRDALRRGEFLSKEETKIINMTVKILEIAGTTDVQKLEELTFEVSALKGAFLSKYIKFKDEIEEIGIALMRFKKLSRRKGNLLIELTEEFEDTLENLRYFESSFNQTLRAVRDTFETLHLKTELIQSKENLEIQKKASALQAATAVIEFIAVFYYTMGIWDKYANLETIPKWISFSTLFTLSAVITLLTESFGEFLLKKEINKKFIIYTLILLFCMGIIVSTIFF